MIIVITGLIGSGKTTLASFFKDKGANVINVDALGQKVLQGPAKQKVTKVFGKGILKRDGKTISAAKLAEIVFKNRRMLHRLHKVTHHYIKTAIRKNIRKHKVNVIDAALFKDFNLHKISDYTILVRAPLVTRIKRCAGTHNETDFLLRQRFQVEPKRTDYIVQNNKHVLALKREADRIWKHIVQ